MKSSKIDKLLEKYFNAETTMQEEITLREFFTNNKNLHPRFMQYQMLFRYFNDEKCVTNETYIKVKKEKWKWVAMVAASILLLFSVYGDYQNDNLTQSKLAFAQTKSAINLLSMNVNKSAGAIKYLNEYETTKNKIFK